ncbi:hypothetical protein [Nannocystis punicea]|uniref:Transposase n=1 Tax=Nannocystis punicea TaxID=2995304 RepID=A0ABY7H6K5_9BACT|nr:hypothetical protein [Nannocystis poenicansa]WAS94867.1 hypothetical protein O0S08_01790 [Nannocystis poenicansa]
MSLSVGVDEGHALEVLAMRSRGGESTLNGWPVPGSRTWVAR